MHPRVITLNLPSDIDYIKRMRPEETQTINTSALILAFASGVFSGLAIATVLVALGVTLLESLVFAGLSGFTIACFVWIERNLIAQLREKDHQLSIQIERRLDHQEKIYSSSIACFVLFDAGTLIIDQVSLGFLKMLRLPADKDLQGQQLEEVLQVNPLKLESLVDSLKEGESSLKQPKVEIRTSDGFPAQALISGIYYSEEHMVEAAFLVPPINNAERVSDLENAEKDLDRFRKGMFRRETRILELKEEVNQVCKQVGLPQRYQTDVASDDSEQSLNGGDSVQSHVTTEGAGE